MSETETEKDPAKREAREIAAEKLLDQAEAQYSVTNISDLIKPDSPANDA